MFKKNNNKKNFLSILKFLENETATQKDWDLLPCTDFDDSKLSEVELIYFSRYALKYYSFEKTFPFGYTFYFDYYNISFLKNLLFSILDFWEKVYIERGLHDFIYVDNNSIIQVLKTIIKENVYKKEHYNIILDWLDFCFYSLKDECGEKNTDSLTETLKYFKEKLFSFIMIFIDDFYSSGKHDYILKKWFETQPKRPFKLWDEEYVKEKLKTEESAISFLNDINYLYYKLFSLPSTSFSIDNSILKIIEDFFERIYKSDTELGIAAIKVIALFSSDKYIIKHKQKLSYYLLKYIEEEKEIKEIIKQRMEKYGNTNKIIKFLKNKKQKIKISIYYILLRLPPNLISLLHEKFPFLIPSTLDMREEIRRDFFNFIEELMFSIDTLLYSTRRLNKKWENNVHREDNKYKDYDSAIVLLIKRLKKLNLLDIKI